MMKIVVKAEAGGMEKAMFKVRKDAQGTAALVASMRDDFQKIEAASARIGQNMRAATRGRLAILGPAGMRGASAIKAPPRLSPAAIVQQMGIQGAIAQYGGRAMAGDPFGARVVNAANAQRRSIGRAQNFLNPQQQDPAQMVMQAIMRSRFMQQGGKMVGMPLGVDMARLLRSGQGAALKGIMGGGGAGGGAALALSGLSISAGIAAAGLTGFAAATKLTMNAMDQARQDMNRSGGNPSQAGVLRGLGMDPRSLVDRAMSTDLGKSELIKAGGSILPPEFGGPSALENAKKMVARVRGAPNDLEARKIAERFGAPELLDSRRWSQDQYARFNGLNPQGVAEGANSMSRLNLELEMLKANLTSAGSPLMEVANGLTFIAEQANKMLEGKQKLAETNPMANAAIDTVVFGPAINALRAVGLFTKKPEEEKDTQERIAKATEKTAKATEAIYRDGLSGGGNRARNAVPDRWRGMGHQEAEEYGVKITNLKLGIL